MKNIIEILKQAGITVTEDQLANINTEMKENYKPIADYNKQKEKLEAAEETVKTMSTSLESFKNVDPAALNKTIEELQTQLSNKDAEFAARIADRDFEDLLNRNITGLKGKNAKAIQALLDIDSLKKSQNQDKDIQNALQELAKAPDASFLFETESAQPKVNPIGRINHPEPAPNYLDSVYGNNPYYKPQ